MSILIEGICVFCIEFECSPMSRSCLEIHFGNILSGIVVLHMLPNQIQGHIVELC